MMQSKKHIHNGRIPNQNPYLPAKHFKEAFQVNLSDPLVNVGTVNSPNAHLTLILRLGEREHHYAQECLYL
jgi:hypothetical protein